MDSCFKWARTGGYEVSSKGDWRFSALFATMPDGRTIEMHYQCDGKLYDPGGRNWKLGKGKPPMNGISKEALWGFYLDLWRVWARNNIDMMRELYFFGKEANYIFSDIFAHTEINQARALVIVLNELCGLKGESNAAQAKR